MKKITPDIFLRDQNNPQSLILNKLASWECTPFDSENGQTDIATYNGKYSGRIRPPPPGGGIN